MVWDYAMLGAGNKEQSQPTESWDSAILSEWEMATRGGCGEKEGLTWTHRRFKQQGALAAKGHGGQRPLLHWGGTNSNTCGLKQKPKTKHWASDWVVVFSLLAGVTMLADRWDWEHRAQAFWITSFPQPPYHNRLQTSGQSLKSLRPTSGNCILVYVWCQAYLKVPSSQPSPTWQGSDICIRQDSFLQPYRWGWWGGKGYISEKDILTSWVGFHQHSLPVRYWGNREQSSSRNMTRGIPVSLKAATCNFHCLSRINKPWISLVLNGFHFCLFHRKIIAMMFNQDGGMVTSRHGHIIREWTWPLKGKLDRPVEVGV
jgi:hypothetical protein